MNASEVIDLLLEVAAREAVSACYPEITPGHVLIALSRLSEFEWDSEFDSAKLRRQFEILGIEPIRFRRRLRALLGKGSAAPSETGIHRSPDCKAAFTHARAIAAQQGMHLNLEHLLNATLLSLARINGHDPGESKIECPSCKTKMQPSFVDGLPYCSYCGTKVDRPNGVQKLPKDEIPTEL